MSLRILPFRQYSDHDVVNLYALESDDVLDSTTGSGGGDAGVFVTVSAGNFDDDPITYQTNAYLGDTSYPFLGTTEMYPQANLKVTGAGSGVIPLGITLFQTAKNDENGEKLLYHPTKQTELQAMLPGQAVPIATKGVFTLSKDAIAGEALHADLGLGSGIRIADATADVGQITGCLPTHDNAFGTVLGTGNRANVGITTDQFSGDYIVVKIDC
tara:strand:+ start:1271 stop:1912 length:642 start_codon:yes stop_codon:yes gene_type:complete